MTQLLSTAAILRWMNELATQGVFTTDADLVVRSWNRWLERATGRPEASVVGRPLLEMFPEIAGRKLDRYYEAALRGEFGVLAQRFHGWLLRIPTAAGEMPQSCRIGPLIEGNTVVGTLTVIEDVSERVESETALRQQIATAEHARLLAEEALRVKDEFLATLSHELRTPLNAVLGWTNILLGHAADAAMLDRALHVIQRNATAQARLIDDMLDMARIVSGKLRLEMRPVDLVAATRAAIDVVEPAAQAKQITIERHLGRKARLITADADRIQQVAWNVLSNAVKFTPSGGRIDVSIEGEGPSVTLIVSDTGKGIPPEFLPHVFERFRQADSSVSRMEGGLGLGLALVRQLVEMHGGQVGVTSPGPGQGTTFTVTLPAVLDEEVWDAGPRAKAFDSRTLHGYRVLIVDDDPDWRELLETALTAHGASVVAAGAASDALQAVTAGEPAERPDALVADIGLPQQDGYSLIRQIRALEGPTAKMPAIAVTAYADARNQRLALEAGFDTIRSKPIAPEAVAAAVIDLLKMRATPRRLKRRAPKRAQESSA